MQVPLFYKDRPLYGFDMGNRTVKVAQLRASGKKVQVLGYGQISFPAKLVVDGVITDPGELAEHIQPLLQKNLIGRVSARRVAASLPMGKIFVRSLKLPPMSQSDLDQAIHYEAEQYIPVPINELYLDYEVTRAAKPGTKASKTAPATADEQTEVTLVATPRKIVDSYLQLFERLGLEVSSIETSLHAVTRALRLSHPISGPTLVVDFGSRSTDIAIFEQALLLTSSIAIGGDHLTDSLVEKLAIKPTEATEIKFKFGLGESELQRKIQTALKDQLQAVVAEVKKVLKYYQDQGKDRPPIKTLLLCGGSASLPGLDEYLTKELDLATMIGNPWGRLHMGKIKPVSVRDIPVYTAAIGLASRELKHD